MSTQIPTAVGCPAALVVGTADVVVGNVVVVGRVVVGVREVVVGGVEVVVTVVGAAACWAPEDPQPAETNATATSAGSAQDTLRDFMTRLRRPATTLTNSPSVPAAEKWRPNADISGAQRLPRLLRWW
ncbi:hypothetical protein ACFVVM_11200 [Nocardia sp. NPDC058176]|uniref:hypothetical protein n=1 Tax=Nocardia sp. NPDC058176 TaxID=3346368 RepID=UPI0036DB7CA8